MSCHRILVVDDNDALRENLAELLESEGYEVAVAEDGGRALARLAGEWLPHVIVLDLLMPGMDGRDLVARIRRDPRLAGVRVILTSGLPSSSLRSSDAVDAYLAKPFGVKDLLATLASLCGQAVA